MQGIFQEINSLLHFIWVNTVSLTAMNLLLILGRKCEQQAINFSFPNGSVLRHLKEMSPETPILFWL